MINKKAILPCAFVSDHTLNNCLFVIYIKKSLQNRKPVAHWNSTWKELSITVKEHTKYLLWLFLNSDGTDKSDKKLPYTSA
jgi:hypothetical protein